MSSSLKHRPLFNLCNDMDWNGVLKYVKENPRHVRYSDNYKYTALHRAVLENAPLHVIKVLYYAYPEAATYSNEFGMIPLAHAISVSCSSEIFQFLLSVSDRVPSTSINDLLNPSITGIPSEVMMHDIIGKLENPLTRVNKNGWSILHLLILKTAPFEQIRMFVDAVPDATRIANNTGDLPLHCACLYGSSIEIIQLLVDIYPGGVCAVNHHGNYPFHLAFENGSPGPVVYLLYHSMLAFPSESISSSYDYGETSLELGVFRNLPVLNVIKLLIKRISFKGCLDVRNNQGLRPIDYAREFHPNDTELISLLSNI